MGRTKAALKDYRKVQRSTDEKKEVEEEPAAENEFKIGSIKSPKAYISAAIDVLEKGLHKSIVLKGRGQTISKVVNIAEVVKRRVKGLHQVTEMESTEVVDVYEPKDPSKGLANKEVNKHICGLNITLSTEPLDSSKPGYQEPLPDAEVTEEDKQRRSHRARNEASQPGGRGRGDGTGGRGSKGAPARGRGAPARGRGGSAGRGGRSGDYR